MKVTLRETYNWKTVVLEPSVNGYNSEFFSTEIEYQDVMEMLKVQVQMEALQQRLQPLFATMTEVKKASEEAKTEIERLEKEGENLPIEINEEDIARLQRPV